MVVPYWITFHGNMEDRWQCSATCTERLAQQLAQNEPDTVPPIANAMYCQHLLSSYSHITHLKPFPSMCKTVQDRQWIQMSRHREKATHPGCPLGSPRRGHCWDPHLSPPKQYSKRTLCVTLNQASHLLPPRGNNKHGYHSATITRVITGSTRVGPRCEWVQKKNPRPLTRQSNRAGLNPGHASV